MGRYILRRVWHGLIVVFGVTVIVFVVTRLVGDPVQVMLPMEATVEQRAAFEQRLGLDRPIPIQFVDFVVDAVRLDFGDSLWQHRPAMEIVFEKLPLTLILTAVGLGLAFVLAAPLGMAAALRPGGLTDKSTIFLSLIGLSIPQFWLGLLLIVVFAVQLKWLPTSGTASAVHIILPAVTLALPALARLVMIVRSSMIDELNQQYVKTGLAKGNAFFPGDRAPRSAQRLPARGHPVGLGTDPGSGRLFGGGGNRVRLAGAGADGHAGHRTRRPDSAPGHRFHRGGYGGVDQHHDGRGLHPARSPAEADLNGGLHGKRTPGPGGRGHGRFKKLRDLGGGTLAGQSRSDRRGAHGRVAVHGRGRAPVGAVRPGGAGPAGPGSNRRPGPEKGSRQHLLGTDQLGRDVLSRVIHGSRVSLMVGAAVVLVAGTFGVLMGLWAGYSGGRTDSYIMRWIDTQVAFPGLLLALIILAVIGPEHADRHPGVVL